MIYRFDTQEQMQSWLVLYTKRCAEFKKQLPQMKIEWGINKVTI